MSTEKEQIEAGIAALESQRALLGDAVAEAALVPLRARLADLTAAPSSPPQRLKQATILFLDVVGSTTLSQQLDPEDIQAVMDGALARCTALVETHRGKVLQYAGDSLLAVFGADEAREDDPERAVRCGLALLAEGRALGEQVLRDRGHAGFDVRVGIHTGDVLLGGGVDADGSIRGMAVNIAARMEQTAPAGALRISHDTYRRVRGVFDVERQAPLSVKGVDEPALTYLVQRAKPRAFRVAARGIEGVETRMIGRDAELDLLKEAFKRLIGEHRLTAVAVVAEAGLGKSRLLYEFDNWAETRPERYLIFQSRATPQTQTEPYGLLRDILAWWLQIADTDGMQAAKDKLEQGIVPLFADDDGDEMAQAHAHLLGHLIGLDFSASRHVRGILEDARQIRNRGFHAAAQMFRRVAAQRSLPILLQLEDLHYADDGSLEFLNYLVQVDRDVPMLVIGLTRAPLVERRIDWARCAGIDLRIDLLPLDKGVSRLLVNELLKKLPGVPSALRELVASGAEGNPYYMEELVKMLVDEGAIEIGPEQWKLHAEKLLATHVPPTLVGVLQSRLDSLPPAERLALQAASVIGLVFWDEALAAIDPGSADALPALVRRELVVARQDTSLEGVGEYAFRHQILHHVTYDTVLKRDRRAMHARAAAWLSRHAGARAGEVLGATAAHYEQAGDSANACEYFTRAAEHAKARYAHDAVFGHVGRALALMTRSGESDLAGANPGSGCGEPRDRLALRWRLLDVREGTFDLQGRRLEQRADLDELRRVADALDDDHRRAAVAQRRSHLAMRTSEYRAMEDAARQGIALAARAGDEASRLDAQRLLALALTHLGDAATGRSLAQSGLVEARARGLRRVEGLFVNALALIAGMQDDMIVALEMDQQNLLIKRELGDRQREAIALGNLGISWLALGELAQARRCLDEGLRLSQAVGDRAMECAPLGNLSRLALWRGDDAQALAQARAALDVAVEVQAADYEAVTLCRLGDAELALGRHAAAAAAFERAQSLARTIGHAVQHDATAGRAQVALAQRDTAAALRHAEELLELVARGGALQGTEQPRKIQLVCYQVLTQAGDARAAEVLDRAHAELQSRAAAIAETAIRDSFLNNIPEHCAIMAAWQAQHAAPAGLAASQSAAAARPQGGR